MSDHNELITKFTDVTGVTEDRAKFYLESANYGLQLALASFYENEPDTPQIVDDPIESDDDYEDRATSVSSAVPTTSSSGTVTSKTIEKKLPQKPRIATLHNMNKSSSDDDEEMGQAFYAGGSERSGQQVLGPPKRNPMKDYVSEVFRSAQASGAEIIDPSNERSAASSSRGFGGTGYRLGQTPDDHEVLESEARNSSQNIQPVVLKLWRQGFSINDGELRQYDDQKNKEFMASIMRGEIPQELREPGGVTVHVDLEDHRHEEYKRIAHRAPAFSGRGHTLGSPAPNVSSNEASGITITSPGTTSGSASTFNNSNDDNEKLANAQLNIDASQPTTMLQVRLSDGSRLSARFNHTNTVDDIRQFIIVARPQYASQSFTLLTTFPSKELSDGTEQIKNAGLLNAAIMLRLK